MRIITSGGLELSIENNFPAKDLVAPELILKILYRGDDRNALVVQNYGFIYQENIDHISAPDSVVYMKQNILFTASEYVTKEEKEKRNLTIVEVTSKRKYEDDTDDLEMEEIFLAYLDYFVDHSNINDVYSKSQKEIIVSTKKGSVAIYNMTQNPDFSKDINLFLD